MFRNSVSKMVENLTEGDYIMIDDRACIIIALRSHKGTEVTIHAEDVFTGKRKVLECDLFDNLEIPIVSCCQRKVLSTDPVKQTVTVFTTGSGKKTETLECVNKRLPIYIKHIMSLYGTCKAQTFIAGEEEKVVDYYPKY